MSAAAVTRDGYTYSICGTALAALVPVPHSANFWGATWTAGSYSSRTARSPDDNYSCFDAGPLSASIDKLVGPSARQSQRVNRWRILCMVCIDMAAMTVCHVSCRTVPRGSRYIAHNAISWPRLGSLPYVWDEAAHGTALKAFATSFCACVIRWTSCRTD